METQKKYINMRNTIKNYARVAVLTGALSLSYLANADNLPISLETKSDIVNQEQVYNNSLSEARNYFNQAIKDKEFSVKEQEQVEKYLLAAKKINPNLPIEYKNLDSGINKNLHGYSFGTSELQKTLAKDNLEVKVNSKQIPIGFWIGWAIGGVITTVIKESLKQKKEN